MVELSDDYPESTKIDVLELAWLAGLLEGEGSFMMSRNIVSGTTYLYPKIVINMTDYDVVKRTADLFRNNVYKIPKSDNPKYGYKKPRKQAWRAQVSGAKAAMLMEAILPLMGERRAERIQSILSDYGSALPTKVRRSHNNRRAALKRYGHDVSGIPKL